MVGAGLLAKKAVERGLTREAAREDQHGAGLEGGDRVPARGGLMAPLEALGFHTVGYGCTTCIAAGTPVLLADGTARRIEEMPAAGRRAAVGPNAERQARARAPDRDDGPGRARVRLARRSRTAARCVCTPDHEILCADGRWVRADELELGEDRVVVGLEAPLDESGADEAGYVLEAGELAFHDRRRRTSACARWRSRACSATCSATARSACWARAA